MEYSIIILKTAEISEDQWQQLTDGYNSCFDTSRTVDEMKSVDNWSPCGFAYHSIAVTDDGKIMGHQAEIPFVYEGGLKFVLGVDTYVRKEYRKNELLYYEICMPLKKYLQKENVVGTIGVPNDNSRPFAIRVFKDTYVDDLNYYLLPVRVSKLLKKKWLFVLDYLWYVFLGVWLLFHWLLALVFNKKERMAKYRIAVDDDFYSHRFADKKYIKFADDRFRYCYTIYNEEDFNVAYIMDFREKGYRSVRSLIKTVSDIIHKKGVDCIAFIGFLHLKQFVLLRLPRKFVPKRFTFFYTVYDKNKQFDGIDDSKNWDFSLMNYDVR